MQMKQMTNIQFKRSSYPKSCFFKKTNEIDKPLRDSSKKKNDREDINNQYQKK